MRVARHKCQIVLFFIAIIVPDAVLILLAGRIMVQDKELATKRVSDQRLAAVSQLRRELAASLEAMKLQEINRQIRPPGQTQDSAMLTGDSPNGPRVARYRRKLTGMNRTGI
jgi:hypothetical protein